ncbi:MAG: hypothetical protein JSW54_03900 [Fidelibacterota bacterium]|nr:MAG: hypothetical protein JSW54_03900 [Candidatus Neomarinimicrobiota bacterium]
MAARSSFASTPVALVLIGILGLSGPVLAQRDITGKTWTHWDDSRKTVYLMGFYAGFRADGGIFRQAEKDHPLQQPIERNPASVDRYKVERREYYSRKLKYDFKMIRQLVDVFYTDPDNLLIPVPEAIRIIVLRADGNIERSEFLLLRERRESLKGR